MKEDLSADAIHAALVPMVVSYLNRSYRYLLACLLRLSERFRGAQYTGG